MTNGIYITVVSVHASCNCIEQLLQNLDSSHLLSYSNHCNLFQIAPEVAATCLRMHPQVTSAVSYSSHLLSDCYPKQLHEACADTTVIQNT